MELEHPITETVNPSNLLSLEQEEHELMEKLETEPSQKQKKHLCQSESHKEPINVVAPAEVRHVSFVVEGTCLERKYSNPDSNNESNKSKDDSTNNKENKTTDNIDRTDYRQAIENSTTKSMTDKTDTISDHSASINSSETQQLSFSSLSSSLLGSCNYNSSASNNSLNVNHSYCPPNNIRAEIAALRDFAVERTIEVARVASDLGYEVVMRTPTLTAARSSMFLENNSLSLSKNSMNLGSDDNYITNSKNNSKNNRSSVESSKSISWQNCNSNIALPCLETSQNAIASTKTKICTNDKSVCANLDTETINKSYLESENIPEKKLIDHNCSTKYSNNKNNNKGSIYDWNNYCNRNDDDDDDDDDEDNSSETINDCESEKSEFDRSIDESVEVPFLVEAFHNHHLLAHPSNSNSSNKSNNNNNEIGVKEQHQQYEEEQLNAEQHKQQQVYSFSSCDSDRNTLTVNAQTAFITAAECHDDSSCHAQYDGNRTNLGTNELLVMEQFANNNNDNNNENYHLATNTITANDGENTEYQQPMSFDHPHNWAATSAVSLWTHSLPDETSISSAENNYHSTETHNLHPLYERTNVNEHGAQRSATQDNRSANVLFDNLEADHQLHEPTSSEYSVSNSTNTTAQTTAHLNEHRWNGLNDPESENNSYTHNYSISSNVSSGVGVEPWVTQDVSHFVNSVNENVINNNNNNNIVGNNANTVATSITSPTILNGGNNINDNNLLHPDANFNVRTQRNRTIFLMSNNVENEMNNINAQRTQTLRESVNVAVNRERVNIRNIVNVPNSTHYHEFSHS